MAKRNTKQIEADFVKIREYVENNHPTSIKEVADRIDLTIAEVRTSLARHPRVEKKILSLIEKNREEKKISTQVNTELDTEANAQSNIQETANPIKVEVQFTEAVVIDASICGIPGIEGKLANLNVILTSVTIRELEKMQKFNDWDGKSARRILLMAANLHETFHTVLIEENQETADDNIVEYCRGEAKRVTLLTADKVMALKARMYGIKTQFMNHSLSGANEPKKTVQTTVVDTPSVSQVEKTLHFARMEGSQLVVQTISTPYRYCTVLSKGIKYSQGRCVLRIGDSVYALSVKDNYLQFTHFEITNISDEHNCKIVYSRKIYTSKDISELPVADYKTFIRNFKST